MAKSPPVRVFISHASEDTWVARQIAREIRACGAATFLDGADIAHGDDFPREIRKAARQCSELLLLLTPWALSRPYIWLEIGYFHYREKRIVAVLHGMSVAGLAADPGVPALLKQLDLVELGEIEGYFRQLRDRIRSTES